MSRILVTGINYAPETIGTGKYTGEMCEWLAARGHEVRAVAAPPYYPGWKTWSEFRGRGYHREQRNGVEVIRCPIWVPRKPNGLSRILHLASFGLSSAGALAYSRNWKPDWVINVAPTLASAPGAWALARLTGARCWLHLQDFEVDAASDMGIVTLGPLHSVALSLERWLLRRFDVVSTISLKMRDRLSEKGVAAHRLEYFPNWADLDGVIPLETSSPYREELNIPDDAVVALYSGNMNLKQGLELLGEAARALAGESRLYFVFGGQGPGRAMLEQSCGGLSNVRFLDLQPTERLCAWLGLADIHLLPQRADVADLVMPSKLTGMLASGRAILATASPATGVAEAVQGRGLATAPGDTAAFVAALRQLVADPNSRRSLGRAARRYAEATLSRTATLLKFEQRIKRDIQ